MSLGPLKSLRNLQDLEKIRLYSRSLKGKDVNKMRPGVTQQEAMTLNGVGLLLKDRAITGHGNSNVTYPPSGLKCVGREASRGELGFR